MTKEIFRAFSEDGKTEIKIETLHFNKKQTIMKAEETQPDFEWVCNECNYPNFTSSVSEEEIDLELHTCINCGCFEMHKRNTPINLD